MSHCRRPSLESVAVVPRGLGEGLLRTRWIKGGASRWGHLTLHCACARSLRQGGTAFPRAELAQIERSVRRLRTMHSKMLMDIEKVQIHFGGSVKASSQMIRELLQAQCLSHPCYKR